MPRSWRNRTGERERFEGANGWSLPRGDSPIPITLMVVSIALSASYYWDSTFRYVAAESALPGLLYCGSQKRGWFGSLPIT